MKWISFCDFRHRVYELNRRTVLNLIAVTNWFLLLKYYKTWHYDKKQQTMSLYACKGEAADASSRLHAFSVRAIVRQGKGLRSKIAHRLRVYVIIIAPVSVRRQMSLRHCRVVAVLKLYCEHTGHLWRTIQAPTDDYRVRWWVITANKLSAIAWTLLVRRRVVVRVK